MQLNAATSKYHTENLEPLFHELENISVSSEFQASIFLVKSNAVCRLVANTYQSLMRRGLRMNDQRMFSTFLEYRENLKAGLAPMLSELRSTTKWSSSAPSGLLHLEGVRESCQIRLVPGIVIDPDDPHNGSGLLTVNITHSGVLDHAMSVYKTLDVADVQQFEYHEQGKRGEDCLSDFRHTVIKECDIVLIQLQCISEHPRENLTGM
ncbi:uncharacterized protein BT62DRAFT_370437 [Guyanagaster necrorhizus]|uniref:Uncharacterized protein n=1 Tax=Guyanagaster necrorhizus TaxID=856835 RepID=A0A9P7VLG1_9AGAR|nr:uncharacterized protein BT62DRAFT_370437 [Guyanagaster necrorhizus MCA 3950]KAG7442705.1 hypothetical protein BT62DRAFT_370437 [Guyanagaster necrorhizus MCA 3950]